MEKVVQFSGPVGEERAEEEGAAAMPPLTRHWEGGRASGGWEGRARDRRGETSEGREDGRMGILGGGVYQGFGVELLILGKELKQG